jgi:hypothetical protein
VEKTLMKNGRGKPTLLGKDGYPWTTGDLRKLRRLAKERTAVTAAAAALGRTPAAVQQKAIRSGIAFGDPWTTADLRKLKRLAKERTAVTAAAEALGRTPAAVRQKAIRSDIAFQW